MSKKTSTNTVTDQATHNTITPSNPAWVDSGLAGIGGRISDLSHLDPYSLIAGPSALQTQAATAAGGLTSLQGFTDAQSALKAGTGAQGQSLLDGLDRYMNPYTDRVVNTSLADFDQSAGRTRAADMLAKAGDATFGGSSGAIQTSLSNDALTRARATMDAQLRDQAFNTGAGLSNSDAARRQEAISQQIAAANGLTSNAAAQGQDTRANIGLQTDIGSILQQLAQQKAGAPVSLLGTQAGLMAGLPLGLLHGQTDDGTMHGTQNSTQTVSDPMGSIGTGLMGAAALFGAPFTGGASLGLLGSLGAGAAGALNIGGAGALARGLGGFMSDRRLKRDIEKVGELPSGLGVYLYRYLWSPIQFLGVMAQEVLKVKPEAVVTMPNGYLAVRYDLLGA